MLNGKSLDEALKFDDEELIKKLGS